MALSTDDQDRIVREFESASSALKRNGSSPSTEAVYAAAYQRLAEAGFTSNRPLRLKYR